MKTEIWKDIPNYEGEYQVSTLGNVKSLKFGKEKLLKKTLSKDNYYVVSLYLNSKDKVLKIHQIQAITFFNHIPNGNKMVVDHIDNNPLNNHLDNLQLITQRENSSKDQKNRSSKYVGVSLNKKLNKWVAFIKIDGKQKHLGYFKNEIDAHFSYQNKLNEIKL